MKKCLLALAVACSIINTVYAQCGGFYDGFESGTFASPWAMGTGTYTMTVPSSGAAVGTYYLNMSSAGSNAFYQGPIATFTAAQPNYVSWWVKSDNGTSANGYFVLGDGNIASDNGILFCYITAGNNIRFFASTGYNYPITINAWHHVEAMNMNWTSRTMDIYVDGVLILTAWPFRSTTCTAVDRVLMHSLNAANVGYDNITIGSQPVSATAVQNSVSCFGGTNGSASVTASGGNGTYTYSWAPSGGTAATAAGLSAGTYTCTITDGLGCTGTQSITVTEPTALTAGVMQTNVLCNGASTGDAMVMVSGGTPSYTYSWTPSGGTGSMAMGLAAGTYTCAITDANGCALSQTFNITEPSQPLMTAAANNGNVCPWDTAMLVGTAMGGTMNYSYNWLPGNLSGSTPSTTPGGTTTYTLVVTDANGCVDSSTTTVTVYATPVVSLGSDTTACGSVTLDAGNSGSTYAWNEGSTTQMISVSVSGPYDVVVTDANGCMGYDSVNVTINANPMVVGSASMNFACVGEPTINLFGSPAGGTWAGPGVFGNTFEPDTAGAGIHSLVYSFTDSLGCSGVDTVQIDVQLCLGSNNATAINYNVYPNPNNGTFTISIPSEVASFTTIITNVNGQVVYHSQDENVHTKQVSLGNQAAGIYFMQITSGDSVSTFRITVTK